MKHTLISFLWSAALSVGLQCLPDCLSDVSEKFYIHLETWSWSSPILLFPTKCLHLLLLKKWLWDVNPPVYPGSALWSSSSPESCRSFSANSYLPACQLQYDFSLTHKCKIIVPIIWQTKSWLLQYWHRLGAHPNTGSLLEAMQTREHQIR